MLDFKRLALGDRQELTRLLKGETGRGCEYTFGNLFIWDGVYDTKLAMSGGSAVVRFDRESESYLFPVGGGDLRGIVGDMIDDSAALGRKFHVIAAGPADCERLEQLFPGEFVFHPSRDYAEYVYNAADLIDLPGKKYHQKRNHIARFERENPGYSFQKIDEQNISRVFQMSELWCKRYGCVGNTGLKAEHCAVLRAFEHFFDIGFDGGFIERDGGEVVAFSMGEEINSETYCVHIEKSFHDITGGYAVINREFARAFCGGYKYINREDDVGEEGLRKAKLSYYPAIITDKFTVRRRSEL